MGVKLVRRIVKSNVDEPITLNNGYIVVHRRVDSDEVLGVYMVTSFRGSLKSGDKTNKEYCSLVSLNSGYLCFEERCSRNTTVGRVLAHLSVHSYKGAGEELFNSGHRIDVYGLGEYDITLAL